MNTQITEKTFGGVKFTTYVETSKQVKKNYNKVMLQVYWQRKYLLHNLGYSANNGKLDAEVAKAVDSKFSWIYTKSVDLINNEEFSFQRIKDLLSSGVVGCSTFNELFRAKVERLEKGNQLGTHRHYRCALASFQKILGNVSLSDFGPSIVSKWVVGMTKEGLSQSTQRFYLSDLKSVVNEAIYNRYLKDNQYPFKRGSYDYDANKVKLPKSVKRTENYLTLEEMRLLWDWNMEHQDKFVSIFLLSYLTGGMNLADLLLLEFDTHYTNTNGRELAYIRRKTQEKAGFKVRVPVTSKLEILFDILNPERTGRVLRLFEIGSCEKEYQSAKFRISSRIADRLPRLLKKLGIEKSISMTWARHSFATIATKQQMPYAFIEAMMGHSNNEVSSHYIGSYSTQEMCEMMEQML